MGSKLNGSNSYSNQMLVTQADGFLHFILDDVKGGDQVWMDASRSQHILYGTVLYEWYLVEHTLLTNGSITKVIIWWNVPIVEVYLKVGNKMTCQAFVSISCSSCRNLFNYSSNDGSNYHINL